MSALLNVLTLPACLVCLFLATFSLISQAAVSEGAKRAAEEALAAALVENFAMAPPLRGSQAIAPDSDDEGSSSSDDAPPPPRALAAPAPRAPPEPKAAPNAASAPAKLAAPRRKRGRLLAGRASLRPTRPTA